MENTLPTSFAWTIFEMIDLNIVVVVESRMAIRPPTYNIHSLTAKAKKSMLMMDVTISEKIVTYKGFESLTIE